MTFKSLYIVLTFALLTSFNANASAYFAQLCKGPPSWIKYTLLLNATIETIAATTDNDPSPYFYVRERNTIPVIIADNTSTARMSELVKIAYLTQTKVNICLEEGTAIIPISNYTVRALELDLK